jgi:hypothetical protein
MPRGALSFSVRNRLPRNAIASHPNGLLGSRNMIVRALRSTVRALSRAGCC